MQEKASHSQHDLVKHRNILAKSWFFSVKLCCELLLYLFAWLLPFYGLQSDSPLTSGRQQSASYLLLL